MSIDLPNPAPMRVSKLFAPSEEVPEFVVLFGCRYDLERASLIHAPNWPPLTVTAIFLRTN